MIGAQFAVVPIIEGSGVKVKLLDAMAIGAPVVTTLHGRQGVFSDVLQGEEPFCVVKMQMPFCSTYMY